MLRRLDTDEAMVSSFNLLRTFHLNRTDWQCRILLQSTLLPTLVSVKPHLLGGAQGHDKYRLQSPQWSLHDHGSCHSSRTRKAPQTRVLDRMAGRGLGIDLLV